LKRRQEKGKDSIGDVRVKFEAVNSFAIGADDRAPEVYSVVGVQHGKQGIVDVIPLNGACEILP